MLSYHVNEADDGERVKDAGADAKNDFTGAMEVSPLGCCVRGITGERGIVIVVACGLMKTTD